MPNSTSQPDLTLLSVTDKLQLIEELWASLDADAGQFALPEWHRHEIDRRLDALDKGLSQGSKWDAVTQ